MAEGLEDPQVCWGAALQLDQEALHGPLPQAGQLGEFGVLGVGGLVGF